ncbi:anaerobic benzoate catabolism transcriptional regulator [bacterium BMS3Abin01]|nr:anaerobic benzoate catabolism transcriptional regulator [bacterium BMS3Abin01]HDY69487.1 XRE family transcriptional regulator [Actinomycetota bacterium]
MVLTTTKLGERIASARRGAGMTQAEMADHLGIDRSAVAKIEKGVRKVDSLELLAISEAVGEPVDSLLSQEQPLAVHLRSLESSDPQLRQQLRWVQKFMSDYAFLKEITDD